MTSLPCSSGIRLLPMVVDAHVHLYPAEVAADPAGWARARGENSWAALVTEQPGRRAVQGWADVDRMLRDMDSAGVDRAVLLGWYWENHDTCRWQNALYSRVRRAHPDRFEVFATLQPRAGPVVLEEVRRWRDEGFRGLGELSPHAQGVSLEDPLWLELLTLAGELGLAVNLHVSEPTGPDYPGKVPTPLDDFQRLAARCPGTTFILAHWGGLLPLHTLNRRTHRDLANVYYDTAATPLLYDARVYRTVLDLIGPERVLWGSDYPLLVYPQSQREPEFTRVLSDLRAHSRLRAEELSLLLGGNARRLLRL